MFREPVLSCEERPVKEKISGHLSGERLVRHSEMISFTQIDPVLCQGFDSWVAILLPATLFYSCRRERMLTMGQVPAVYHLQAMKRSIQG